jgi:hypothetical protein
MIFQSVSLAGQSMQSPVTPQVNESDALRLHEEEWSCHSYPASIPVYELSEHTEFLPIFHFYLVNGASRPDQREQSFSTT